MQWLFPAGAWAAVAGLAVLALYFLKRQTVRHDVPSLLLWREAVRAETASRPFQKLRKNILLFLQLALVALLVLSLMRPALPGGVQGETVLIFDTSASMQAVSGGESRLDEAKKRAKNLISGMKSGDRVSVMAAGQGVEQIVTRSLDLVTAQGAIDGIRAGNGASALSEAVSLAEALGQGIPGLNIIVFSDTYESDSPAVTVSRVGLPADNRAILSLSADDRGDAPQAFARVANCGSERDVQVECYADGRLVDVREVHLGDGETGSVVFSVPEGYGTLRAALSGSDALAADDERWCVRPSKETYSVALVGESVFLEKAVMLRDDMDLVRTTAEDLPNAGEFDLTIFAGKMPENLPGAGCVIAVDPAREVFGITPGEKKPPAGTLTAAEDDITENLELTGIAVRTVRPLSGGRGLVFFGDDAVISSAEADGRRAVVFGFSLNDSNLPLKADFPVLMQNILSWLLPDVRGTVDGASCGDGVEIPRDSRAVSARVELPNGSSVDAVIGAAFRNTNEKGVYKLVYVYSDGSTREIGFALHVPDGESDTRRVGSDADAADLIRETGAGGREITWVALGALLAVLILEWVVSRRVA